MRALAKGLLALSIVIAGLGCGIKKPLDTGDSIHPGVTDDGGPGGAGEGGAAGDGVGGIAAEGSGGTAGQVGPVETGGIVGTGSGGAVSTGGRIATGGVSPSGGAIGSGGTASGGAAGSGGQATGGAIGSGGTSSSGGAVGTGGVTASGGIVGSGSGGRGSGGNASGGTIGTGGVTASGGAIGSGGTVAGTGGISATGGATLAAGSCDTPIEISTSSSRTDVTVNTSGHGHVLDVPCAPTGSGVVLSFTLTQRELVYADTFGASWDTVLSFGDDCDGTSGVMAAAGTAACNSDACGTTQSQAIALLGYGRHYLFVTGLPNQSGAVTVHFQHALAGSGPLTLLAAGAGTAQGNTSGTGSVSLCEASAPENSYWWSSCPTYAGGTLAAATCTGTTFDTVLSLQIPRAGTLNCADDDPACGVRSKMSALIPAGAGLHVLTVDGGTGSSKGAYTLTYNRP